MTSKKRNNENERLRKLPARAKYWPGGCCATEVKWARVSYCPECRRVLAERTRKAAEHR